MKNTQTKAESPINKGCRETKYLTKGKVYDITDWSLDGRLFYINDDTGEVLTCGVKNCAHLNGEQWILS